MVVFRCPGPIRSRKLQAYSCKPPALITSPREYEPRFNGIYANRTATDVLWIYVFAACVILEAFLIIFVFKRNTSLTRQTLNDSWGNICGQSQGYESKLYLFEYSDHKENLWNICLENCPDMNWSWVDLEAVEKLDRGPNLALRQKSLICRPGFNATETIKMTVEQILRIDEFQCAVYYFSSKSLNGKCFQRSQLNSLVNTNVYLRDLSCRRIFPTMPGNDSLLFNQFNNLYHDIANDLRRTFPFIFALGFLGLFITIIFILFMRTFAVALIYFIQIMCNLLIAAVAIFSFYKAYEAAKSDEMDMPLEDLQYWRSSWTIIALLSTLGLLVVFFFVFFLKAKIQVASTVIEHSSKAMGYMKECLVLPLFTVLLKIGLLINMIILTTGIVSWMLEGERVYWQFYLMHIYNIFFTWWSIRSICAFSQLIIYGCVSNWYFSTGEIVNSFIFFNSLKRTITYHTGTIFGGAIMKDSTYLLRLIFRQIDRQVYAKNYNNRKKFLSIAFFICIKINDCFLKYLDYKALISVAVYGMSFFKAGLDAYSLYQRNKSKVLDISNIVELIMKIGQYTLAILTGVIGYCIFTNTEIIRKLENSKKELNHIWVPILCTSTFTFLICKEFYEIFNYSAKATIYCVMEGCERNFREEKTGIMNLTLENALLKKKANKTNKLGFQL